MPLWNYFIYCEYKGGNSYYAIAHVLMADSCYKHEIFRLFDILILNVVNIIKKIKYKN